MTDELAKTLTRVILEVVGSEPEAHAPLAQSPTRGA